MHFLRKLLRELHRRSIWQVVGVYVGMSWGVLNGVDVVTGIAGLPDWTPRMAFVLLLAGLPAVVATAFIQRGAPLLQMPEDVEATERVHLSPEDVHVMPGARLFTWRNVTLAAVGAVALLVTSVVAYLTMWALGIGPVGSLVAQGVLERRDPVILAQFENRTEDPALGAAVTDAFRVDLAESQVVTLVDDRLVADALLRMGGSATTVLVPSVAREIAVREAIAAVVEGEVTRVGGGYLLTARIVAPHEGRALVQFRESAADDAELLPAIDRLSARVREKAGESLRSIRAAEPLARVTTSSLEALKKFSAAGRAADAGRWSRSIELLEEAVALDSTFAMAWRKLAVHHFNRGVDDDAAVAAAETAYRHREHLSERERLHTEAMYHEVVTDDREAARSAYERILDGHPDDGTALNNLAIVSLRSGNATRAAELLRRAATGPGESPEAHATLVTTLWGLGDRQGAVDALERWARRYPRDPNVPSTRVLALWGLGREEEAIEVGSAAIASLEDPIERAVLRGRVAALQAARGRFGVARAELDEARRRLEELEVPLLAFEVAATQAWIRILAEADSTAVVATLEALFDSLFAHEPPLNRPYEDMGYLALELAGDAGRARAWWARGDSALPAEWRPDADDPERAAALALAAGRFEAALAALDRLDREEPGVPRTLPERARAAAGLGRLDEAIAALERWLAGPELDWIADIALDGIESMPRLAELYEAAGRVEDARRTWLAFADRFAGGDAGTRSMVEIARRRAEVLAATPGGGV